MLPACEHAAEQNRIIDGRDFRVADAFTVARVHKVIEEAMFHRRSLRQESQGFGNTLLNFGLGTIIPLMADAQRGQTKACGGNAGDSGRAPALALALSITRPVAGWDSFQKNSKAARSI